MGRIEPEQGWRGMKVQEIPEYLLFSQREKLGKIIEEWMSEHNIKNCPASVVSFLSKQGMIDVKRVKQYLKGKDNEHKT
jgi:hypothetical protein